MRRRRVPLFSKILMWFFVNLLVLGAVLLVVFNLRFRVEPDSLLAGAFGGRFDAVAGRIADEMQAASAGERTAILKRYSASYQVEFVLYDENGKQMAGAGLALPSEVAARLRDASMPPRQPGPGWSPRAEPPGPRPSSSMSPDGPPPPGNPPPSGGPPPRPRPRPVFTVRTTEPTRYWAGVRLLIFEPVSARPVRATLLAASDSISGHGLFFDVKPLLLIVALVFALSVVLWLPFVRGLTRTLAQMTTATEQIAEEQFDVRVGEKRSDELGRLGAAINHLARRLGSFVQGQKRFLGDTAHELNSPLARLQVALSILEERVEPAHASYVADAQEEVRVMSTLIDEVLAFASAGIRAREVVLSNVRLLPLVEQVCARECGASEVVVAIAPDLEARAHPDLLSRALANVLRNAVRYAGAAGPISIAARAGSEHVTLSVADRGPGVPPDALERLFEPFFRLEADRARETGGTGLGLAIVKTCVEACQGTVTARSVEPSGLEVRMLLGVPLRSH